MQKNNLILTNEISLPGEGIFQQIRQTDKDQEGNLVFVYPMILDQSLEKNYGNILREFVSYIFTNRIKVGNFLNVVSTATSPSSVKSGNNELNPTQELQRFLGYSPQQQQVRDIYPQTDWSQRRYEYSETIQKMREYIKQQLLHDPQYKELNPVISEIIAQGQIPVPLIIGTSPQKIPSNVLFWILFIAAGQKIPLNNATYLNSIKTLLRSIPSENYEKYMSGLVPSSELSNPRAIENTVSQIFDNVDKALMRFRTVLNEQQFSEEVGVLNKTVNLTTALHNTESGSNSLARRASAAFKSFVAGEIIGKLQSVVHAILPETEIDVSSKITNFVNDVGNSSPIYTAMQEYIFGRSVSGEDIESVLKNAKEICEDNKNINVNGIFAKLTSLQFTITGKPRKDGIFSSNDPGQVLAEFTSDVVQYAGSLSALSNTLEEYLDYLGGNQCVTAAKDFKKNIRLSIENFFIGGWEKDQGITSAPNFYNLNRTVNPTGGYNLFTSNRFLLLTGQITQNYGFDPKLPESSTNQRYNIVRKVSDANQRAFEENMFNSITEITYFLFLYSFLSFFCEYLKEIEAEYTIQKRDATTFPNYVLVVRMEVISRIFWALATRNFHNEVTLRNTAPKVLSGREIDQIDSEISQTRTELSRSDLSPFHRDQLLTQLVRLNDKRQGKPTQTGIDTSDFRISSGGDTVRHINLIKDRLGIPNIIVVDEKSKKIYYKFMFMPTRVLNLSLDSISSYVSQQKDILSVF